MGCWVVGGCDFVVHRAANLYIALVSIDLIEKSMYTSVAMYVSSCYSKIPFEGFLWTKARGYVILSFGLMFWTGPFVVPIVDGVEKKPA